MLGKAAACAILTKFSSTLSFLSTGTTCLPHKNVSYCILHLSLKVIQCFAHLLFYKLVNCKECYLLGKVNDGSKNPFDCANLTINKDKSARPLHKVDEISARNSKTISS